MLFCDSRRLWSVETEELYRLLTELVGEAVYIEREGTFIRCNAAAALLFGAADASELAGRCITDFIREDEREAASEQFKMLNGTHSRLLTMVREDGEVRHVEGSAGPVVYEGEPANQVVLRDVTDRLRLQEEFRHAQKMESIGRLTGGVAHDLNNLLTPIMAYAHLGVSEVDEDHPVSGLLREVHKAARRASHLTQQLLAISRRQSVDAIAVNMNELVLDLDKLFRRVIGEDVELVTLPSREAAVVEVDPTQVEQVLMNLAVNSRDAMPDGGKLIVRIEAVQIGEDAAERLELSPGDYVAISVEDTGVGMTRES